MNILESIADRTYVINLAHRTDRWENVQKQLASIGYEKYERFDAYGVNHLPPENYYRDIPDFKMSGWYGNKFSHYGVIEQAKRDGLNTVMVFEDDVVLDPRFNQVVGESFQILHGQPIDWLQFGGNHRYFGGSGPLVSPIDGLSYYFGTGDGLFPLTPHVARILKMLTAHAYLAVQSTYDFILENAIQSPWSIDGFYAYEVHRRFLCYCVTPCVATQAPGMNDIGLTYSDYSKVIGD